jgi:hypothetical protein
MAGELGDFAENGLLDHLLKGTAFPFAGQTRHFAISRADPGDNGATADEPTGEGNYVRISINGAEWNAAAGRQITNNVDKSFPVLTSAINGATHWMLFDASTGGNYLGKAAIPGTPNFEIGSSPTIEAGTFVAGWQTGGLATPFSNQLLDHLMVKTEFSQLANLYAFLSEGSPGDDFAGVAEPSSNGYARVIANVWDATAAGATQNTNAVTFPKATGDWRTGNNLTFFGLYDALTAGNGVVYGPLDAAVAVNNNERPRWDVGQFAFTID